MDILKSRLSRPSIPAVLLAAAIFLPSSLRSQLQESDVNCMIFGANLTVAGDGTRIHGHYNDNLIDWIWGGNARCAGSKVYSENFDAQASPSWTFFTENAETGGTSFGNTASFRWLKEKHYSIAVTESCAASGAGSERGFSGRRTPHTSTSPGVTSGSFRPGSVHFDPIGRFPGLFRDRIFKQASNPDLRP